MMLFVFFTIKSLFIVNSNSGIFFLIAFTDGQILQTVLSVSTKLSRKLASLRFLENSLFAKLKQKLNR